MLKEISYAFIGFLQLVLFSEPMAVFRVKNNDPFFFRDRGIIKITDMKFDDLVDSGSLSIFLCGLNSLFINVSCDDPERQLFL